MKMETLLNKEELHKVLLRHIMENELVDIDVVTIVDGRIIIALDEVELAADDVREIVKGLTEETPSKQTIVVTPDGSLGVESEFDVD